MRRVNRTIILFLLMSVATFLFAGCYQKSVNHADDLGYLSHSADCRVVQRLAGETCIPQNPQRIITLHVATLGNLLALDVKPIGSTTEYQKSEFANHLESKIDGIESVGSDDRPNLEKILNLKPDLIINLSDDTSVYPLLSKIAPTVQKSWEGPRQWKEHFRFVAEVLGQEDAYQEAWKYYWQRIRELKTALGDRYQSQKISYVYLPGIGQSNLISELETVFAGSILHDAGLQRTDVQDVVTPTGYLFIPEEELSKIDGDILFIGIYADDDKKTLEELKRKPLWKTLKAVQQNHVHLVNLSTWRGENLIAADTVIDDLFQYLVNTP